jgi:phosphatidylinositol alpha-1,6-mannosyltransferase
MLLLTLSTFSSTGGIQKATRSLAYAMKCIAENGSGARFNMYALNDKNCDARYIDEKQFRGFAGHRYLFVARSVKQGLKSNTIILNHINLIPVGILIRMLTKKPKIIIIAHGVEVWQKLANWKRHFLNHHAFIWAVSEYSGNQLSIKNGIHSSRITTLNPGIDPFFKVPTVFRKSQSLLKRYHISNNQQIVLTISRLTKFDTEKGYEKVLLVLPDLLCAFPNMIYLLCGPSEENEKARLEAIIRKNKIQKSVRLISYIPDDQLTAHFQLADLFVLPSKKEGFGLVFTEAAACGCKIISGNLDGSADALQNGRLGMMIDPDNLEQLKYAIIKHLSAGRSDQEAQHIQQICLEKFNPNIFKNKVKNLIFHHD